MPCRACLPRWLRTLAPAVLTVTTLSGCGGGDPAAPGNGSPMTARVDGQAWTALELSVAAIAGQSGSFTVVGTETVNNVSRSINLALYNIRGTGTYPFGVSFEVVGGRAQFSESSVVWATPASGAAGTFTVTALTPTRIAGTFQYTAELSLGNSSTQSHTITDGVFDIPLITNGSLPVVPDNAGSTASASIGGAAYNAATVFATTSNTGDGLGFNSHNLIRQLSMSLSGVTTAGTYPLNLSNGIRLYVTGVGQGGSSCCWGGPASDVGTVTITSVTATRMKGSFSGTLQPQPNSGQTQALVISNGAFDIGR